MSLAFPTPDHMPCPECGASLARSGAEAHVCDEERLLDYRVLELREEIAQFEDDLADWFDTPHGRFALWLAEHDG